MNVILIDPLSDHRWDELVARRRDSAFFHRSSWARVIRRVYGFTPRYVAVENERGEITSGCPFFLVSNWTSSRRSVCMPFTDYCWPLISCDADRKAMTDALIPMNRCDRVTHVEIRGGDGFPGMRELRYYKRSVIDLSQGVPSVWRRLGDKSIRYSIKKAERGEVKIGFGGPGHDLYRFYQLNVLTRRMHGVVPQPYRFFKSLHEELDATRTGFTLLARIHHRIIGGSVFLLHRDMIYHKYNASDPNYKHLCANHLIIWTAIRWAIQRGFRAMDMGRTAPDNEGLLAFKRHWGAVESEAPYYYYPVPSGISAIPEKDSRFRHLKRIIKHSPPALLSAIGGGCYRFIA